MLFRSVLMQMTWIGAPTIYYGDEVGLCGFTDPDNRRTYPWGKEDISLFWFHKHMIQIRKENKVLRTGSIRYMEGDFNYLSYARFNQEEVFIVAVNNSKTIKNINMEVIFLGVINGSIMERLILTHQDGYETEKAEDLVFEGGLKIEMPPQSAMLLRTKIKPKEKAKNFLQFI